MNSLELFTFIEKKFQTSIIFITENNISGELLPFLKESDLFSIPVSQRVCLEWAVQKAKVFQFCILFLVDVTRPYMSLIQERVSSTKSSLSMKLRTSKFLFYLFFDTCLIH